MRSAIETLRLDLLHVVDPGDRSYEIDDRVHVVSLPDLATELTGRMG
jgi:hypothetical protein